MTSLSFREDDQTRDDLVSELIEAHLDTIEMLLALDDDPSWESHVLYLKGLVREAHRLTAVWAASRPTG